MDAQRATTEREFRTRLDEGAVKDAVTAAVRGYGPEILALLRTLARSDVLAEEAFALFCEDLLRAAPSFDRERASLRTWAYVIARNALSRAARQEKRHTRGRGALEQTLIETLVAETRESTASYLRTDVREGIERLRASLSEEEQLLLYLRVEQEMEWADVVAIVAAGDPDPRRASARLRKQFERACTKLRELAAREGIRE